VPPGGYAAPPPGAYRVPPGYQPVPLSPGGQPLASFLDRLLAYLIDGAVFIAVIMVLALPAFFIVFFTLLPELETDPFVRDPDPFAFILPLLLLEAALVVVSLGLGYIYYAEMMFRSGQTLGKKVLKIKIIPIDPAATLNRPMAAKRFLAQHVAGTFIPFYPYVDGLWQLWDKPFQQCLHDKFAQTIVVKVPAQ
jgi:uncharacterized RDD family membrane protein YckC